MANARQILKGGLKFKLPHKLDEKCLLAPDKKVIIISFFGKTQFGSANFKATILDKIIGCQVFQNQFFEDIPVNEDYLCDIEGYLDQKERIIYLHLRGICDTQSLVSTYELFAKDLEEKGYLYVWSNLKHRYARALLFLFAVSHILVVTHPSHVFDLSYVHLFRALDIVRQKILGRVTEILQTVNGLPKDWIIYGRSCSPRVLFFFASCPNIFKDETSITKGSASCDKIINKRKPTIKKLEHALEDQIYHILRKSRIITNVSTNSLFAIPANQEFVYVSLERNHYLDYNKYKSRLLFDFCNKGNTEEGKKRNKLISLDTKMEEQVDDIGHSFKEFLDQHINQAFTKGFDDNVGRHMTHSYFEMPTPKQWFELANKLYKYLMDGEEHFLKNVINTEVKFSEARCGKVLPLATATYQENLPAHYTREYHQNKLLHALSVFAVHARGPSFEQYAIQLEKECERHWRSGRQMCEVLSLTGNPCTKPVHRGGSEGAGGGELHAETQEGDSGKRDLSLLPQMEHLSGVRYIAACNCGRRQGPREDPFSVRAANYDFYVLLGDNCGCSRLESFRFPIFQPSTKDYRAAQLFSPAKKETNPSGKEHPSSTPHSNVHGLSLVGGLSNQSAGAIGLLNEDTSHLSQQLLHRNNPSEASQIVIKVSDTEPDATKDKALVRQPSTTEYLPGMLHSESPPGLLPQFPSWSLVCLGPSSLYSHNLGLQDQQQAGLLGGSAYLLPWDVTVRLEHHRDRNWPAVGDQYSRSRSHHYSTSSVRGRKSKSGNKDQSEFVVKIFVGVEYECPRGHRFMCSAPDKVLKTTGSGLVKDNGNKVTANDMPLYFPCPCRTAKPLTAQLMRIHVVTPKAPIHVTLNPKVRPAPAPCPVFVTGCEEPLKLSQSAYWVLRLPYVYVGEQGPYITPKRTVPASYGCLLSGMYGIKEIPPNEK